MCLLNWMLNFVPILVQFMQQTHKRIKLLYALIIDWLFRHEIRNMLANNVQLANGHMRSVVGGATTTKTGVHFVLVCTSEPQTAWSFWLIKDRRLQLLAVALDWFAAWLRGKEKHQPRPQVCWRSNLEHVCFTGASSDTGLHSTDPPLHSVFTGNKQRLVATALSLLASLERNQELQAAQWLVREEFSSGKRTGSLFKRTGDWV